MAAVLALFAQAGTAFAMPCVRSEEVQAFTLRHLQSRLMVAALSCNQREAYNTFIQHFQPQLADGGRSLTAYFERIGGGRAALNAYVTEVANAAGLSRAADPRGFCEKTWALFLDLEQSPEALVAVAGDSVMDTTRQPAACEVAPTMAAATLAKGLDPIETAAPREAVAAAK